MAKNDDFADPLPEEWLPESAVPPEGDRGYWEGRVRRIMAEAETTLAAYRRPRREAAPWFEVLVRGWRPAAAGAFALAATAVVALVLGAARTGAADPDAFALAVLAGRGDPAALWSGAGVDADPTLAVLMLTGVAEGSER